MKKIPSTIGTLFLVITLIKVYIGKGKHYIQEDQPHNIGQAISNWAAYIN